MTRRIFKDKIAEFETKIERLNNDLLRFHLIVTGISDAHKLTNIRIDKISTKVDELIERLILAPDTPPSSNEEMHSVISFGDEEQPNMIDMLPQKEPNKYQRIKSVTFALNEPNQGPLTVVQIH